MMSAHTAAHQVPMTTRFVVRILLPATVIGCSTATKPDTADSADPADTSYAWDTGEDTDEPDSGELDTDTDAPPPPAGEICNGEDDDEDGLIDEGMWRGAWSQTDGVIVWAIGPGVSTLTTTHDEWSDGTTDFEEVSSQDDNDHVTLVTRTEDEATTTISTTYDDNDLVTDIESRDGAGVLTQATFYTYAGGLMATAAYYTTSFEGVYGLSRTETWTRNGEGQLTEYQEDANGDGTVDTIVSYTYSEGGKVVTESHYITRLEMTYMMVTKTYSETGRLLTEETDTDASGSIDTTNRYTYGDDDQLIEKEQDYDGDGVTNVRTTYSYDSGGRQTDIHTDQDADGVIDRRTSYAWTDNSLFEIQQDEDGDGAGAPWVEYRYALDGVGNATDVIKDPDDATDYGTHTSVYRFTCRD
jgi:hypothetical protein